MRGRAQVRACLWLGLEKDQESWKDCCQGGQPTIFAELVCLFEQVLSNLDLNSLAFTTFNTILILVVPYS